MFVEQCIASVLSQTYPHWEQIVIDDGSTDDTVEIVERIGDPRIRLVRQSHVGLDGLASTYNRALSIARGSLVAILEGDDWWIPDRLARHLAAFDDPAVVLSHGRATVVLDDLRQAGDIPSEQYVRQVGDSALRNEPLGAATRLLLHARGRSLAIPCSVMIRREALEAIGGFVHAQDLGTTDLPTFLALSLRGGFVYDNAVVAYWRRHATAGSLQRQRQMTTRAAEYCSAFLEEHRQEMRLTTEDLREVERSWRFRLRRAAIHEGRRHLVARDWSSARAAFRVALAGEDVVAAAAALVGLGASVMRLDVEWLAALVRRRRLRAVD